jgi:hypothetical protein
MHFYEHRHPFGPERRVNRRLSSSLSLIRHLRWDCRRRSAPFESTFLRSLRSIPVTEFHRYYGRSDSCLLRLFGTCVHELRLLKQTGLPDSRELPSRPFRLQPPDASLSPLLHATPQPDSFPFSGLDFAFEQQARRLHPAESSSSSYGLVVHLLLLSTTHRCVAVAFSYRPESVYLKRTFTSLTTRAFRRTVCHLRRRIVYLYLDVGLRLRLTLRFNLSRRWRHGSRPCLRRLVVIDTFQYLTLAPSPWQTLRLAFQIAEAACTYEIKRNQSCRSGSNLSAQAPLSEERGPRSTFLT